MPDQTQQDAERVERWGALIKDFVPNRWGSALDDFISAAIALADQEAKPDRDAIARRLLSLHGADLDNLAHARRNVDYLLDGEG